MGKRAVILAGPNGAGKSTAAPHLIDDLIQIDAFVNADTIARGLSAFAPEKAAIEAGKIFLARVEDLVRAGEDFAIETTLSSRGIFRWVEDWKREGYTVQLYYLYVPDPEFSIQRVANRVKLGGHHVPDDTIRRRYATGLRNFFALINGKVDAWELFDNEKGRMFSVAKDEGYGVPFIRNQELWAMLKESYDVSDQH